MAGKVLLLMGSGSDFETMSAAADILREFGVSVTVEVTSAHRTPERTVEIVRKGESAGVEVIIAAAGFAAHLAGVVASHTTLPVIGVPLDSSPLSGMDSLLSTVMMPAGVPVATVTVGKAGAKNAAYLALSILSLKYPEIREKLVQFRERMKRDVLEASERVNDKG